jgi:polyhydroxyalkanoate synthesis regulator phasin
MLKRDEKSNSILNDDKIEYEKFKNELNRSKDIRLLKNKINDLEKRLEKLENK